MATFARSAPLIGLILLGAARVSAQTVTPQDLKRLSLEELMRVEVSTVLRAPEPTTAIPAAVFVITQDDIRRSGATSLPEVLRLAPGVQVARIDAARYAIGIRGFADRLARSILVLIDGRAVYSPLFAGTYWEVQDTVLEDIERIEVIRGPGGTLWGANAVNGIINIVTKRAQDTHGILASATVGTTLLGPAGVRYGREIGSKHFRLYGKGFDRDGFSSDDYDAWRMGQAGFRADWSQPSSRTFTVQANAYAAELGQRYNAPLTAPPFSQATIRVAGLSGVNALARVVAPFGGGEFQFQTYYDRTSRDERPVAETRDTVDFDVQHRRLLARRHQVVWGAGYRVSNGRITATPPTQFFPPDRTDHLFTAFAQDDVALVPGRLRLVFGTKIEHNGYSGFEIQPAARLMWTVNDAHAVFGSVTRAVRTPSRVETDYTTTSVSNPAVPAFVRLLPNPEFVPEELTAYEAGYRVRPHASLYVTAASFFNDHDETLSTELLTPFVETMPPPDRLILPVMFRNGLHGNSYGLELTADYRPVSWWRWTGNYSFVRIQMTRDPGSTDLQELRYERQTPRHQVFLQSSLDLPKGILVDWMFRYASELPVAAYGTSDVRIAWTPDPRFEIALVGKDLHEPSHVEWAGGLPIERRAYVSVTWRPG
jgi:iron complex outermembrane receptor protein